MRCHLGLLADQRAAKHVGGGLFGLIAAMDPSGGWIMTPAAPQGPLHNMRPMAEAPLDRVIRVRARQNGEVYRVQGREMEGDGVTLVRWYEAGVPGWFENDGLSGWSD